MIDTNGKEISIGDYIIFSVVHDRTARLRYGIVTKLNKETISTEAYSIDIKLSWEDLENGTRRYYNTTHVVSKKSSFNYPHLKSLVIPYEIIPQSIREVMEKENG